MDNVVLWNGHQAIKNPSLRERNKQRVTGRIIMAAVELFKTKGYQHTTLDDIAEHAEISRGTLFNYFPSKESLLIPWGEEIFERQIRPQLMAYWDTQPTTLEMIRSLFNSMSEHIRVFPDMVQTFMHEALKSHNRELAHIGFQELFISILRYGQTRGEVRMDIPVEHIVRYISGVQMSLVIEFMDAPPEDPIAEIDRLLAFIATGLSPATKSDSGASSHSSHQPSGQLNNPDRASCG